jgi:LCP family protein required for cell wall assembly
MGIDSKVENLSKTATGNGDSLMLVTFNPKTLNATILSIPRDSYVPISCFSNQKENKITHAAWNGESCMIKTIQNFTGIKIDYYLKINFKGVVKLVNALGGVEVNVPVEFCEQNSDRSWAASNKICLKKGKQTLNGEQALALARHRKTLATGDLQRGTNQQLVVQGILNKLKTIKSASQLLSILDTISNSMDTNFTTKQILSFYDIAKNLLLGSSTGNLINIQQLYLSGSGQSIYDEGIGMVFGII